MRIKNPFNERYDALQYQMKMRISVEAILKEKFVLSGKINNMNITLEGYKAYYFEDKEEIRPLDEIQESLDNLVNIF